MLKPSSELLATARAKAAEQVGDSNLPDYDQIAELFRRITDLDTHSLGPELARFENVCRPTPPQSMNFGGKVRHWFFRAVNPILGRVLRAGSLATPFRASYELSIHLHQQQLETERKILSELAEISARLELLEAEIRSRR